MLTTLLPKEATLIPSVYGNQERDVRVEVAGDLPGMIGALVGWITGKASITEGLKQMNLDVKASVQVAGNDLRTNSSVNWYVAFSVTRMLESLHSAVRKAVNPWSFGLECEKTLPVAGLGSVKSHLRVEYRPAELKFYITTSVTSNILKNDLELKLLNVDLSLGRIDFTYSKYLLGNTSRDSGKDKYGNTANPAKPETIEGSSSGITNYSEPIEWNNLVGSGIQSCAVNITDPTELDCVCNYSSTLYDSVGGIVAPVDKFGLLAPYIGLDSTISVALVAAAVYVRRVKRRKEKQ